MMNKYSYNFFSVGKMLFETGIDNTVTFYELQCLARYCMFYEGLSEKVTKEFILNWFTGYVPVRMMDDIDKAIVRGKKLGKLIEVNNLFFTPSDVQFIHNIDNRKHRRIMYAIIIMSRIDGGYYNRGLGVANTTTNSRLTKAELDEFSFMLNTQYLPNCYIPKHNSYRIDIPIVETGYESIFVDVWDIMKSFPDFCKRCDDFIFKAYSSNKKELCDKCYSTRKKWQNQ